MTQNNEDQKEKIKRITYEAEVLASELDVATVPYLTIVPGLTPTIHEWKNICCGLIALCEILSDKFNIPIDIGAMDMLKSDKETHMKLTEMIMKQRDEILKEDGQEDLFNGEDGLDHINGKLIT